MRAGSVALALGLGFALAGPLDGCNGGISTPSAFLTQFAAGYCRLAVRCGVLGNSELSSCRASTQTTLTDSLLTYDLDAAAKDGRLRFDSSSARACLNDLGAASCRDIEGSSPACEAAVTAAVADGLECRSSVECASGLCDAPSGCHGVCLSKAAAGCAHCDSGSYCDQGLCSPRLGLGTVCPAARSEDPCQDGLACVGGMCQALPLEGMACAAGRCARGLYCDEVTEPASPRCAAVLGAGAACGQVDACQDGLACVAAIGSDLGRCVAYLDVGSACRRAPPGLASGCPLDMTCTSSACAPIALALGAQCARAPSTAVACGSGLYCDPVSMTCRAQIAHGGGCDPAVAGACLTTSCDPGTWTCANGCP
jgi:hypothetical protein